MRSFDLFPDRCHDYDLTPARVVKKQYLYQCDKCGQEFPLTAIRHNKMKKKQLALSSHKRRWQVGLHGKGKIVCRAFVL